MTSPLPFPADHLERGRLLGSGGVRDFAALRRRRFPVELMHLTQWREYP